MSGIRFWSGFAESAQPFFLSVFLLLILIFSSKVFAQVGDPRIGEEERMKIAEAWAPTVFHEISPEFTEPLSGFNPVDNLIGIFLASEDPIDVRYNRINVFKLSLAEARKVVWHTPVYVSVAETTSHYYLNFMLYHAIDANGEGHVHDTEDIWMVIEKDGSPYGKFVMMITNAHGFGMIYGPQQAAWRGKQKPEFSRDFLPLIDPIAQSHHEHGVLETIARAHSFSPEVFVAKKSHAVYKFHSADWNRSPNKGLIYVEDRCIECKENAMVNYDQDYRPYTLVDLDLFVEDVLRSPDPTEASLVFSRHRERSDSKVTTPGYEARKLPENLAYGSWEGKSSGTLPQTSEFHTHFSLRDPVSMHIFFAGSSDGISETYVYNFYLNPAKPLFLSAGILPHSTAGRRNSFLSFLSRIWREFN